MELVDILFTEQGQPVKVQRDGRIWNVAVEPTRHFERIRWWEVPGFSARQNSGARIDYALWRMQVRLGHNPRSELLTWDLVEDAQAGKWTVREYETEQIAS